MQPLPLRLLSKLKKQLLHSKHMEFGSQFSVSVFFERTGGQQNYQGIVNNGYCK